MTSLVSHFSNWIKHLFVVTNLFEKDSLLLNDTKDGLHIYRCTVLGPLFAARSHLFYLWADNNAPVNLPARE